MLDALIPTTQKSIQKLRGRARKVLAQFRAQELEYVRTEEGGYYYSPLLAELANIRNEVNQFRSKHGIVVWMLENLAEDRLGFRIYNATMEGGQYGDTDLSDDFSQSFFTAVLGIDEAKLSELREEIDDMI